MPATPRHRDFTPTVSQNSAWKLMAAVCSSLLAFLAETTLT